MLYSPSSILTFKQCPRKFYYQYIEKLPTKKSFSLIRGSIVHTVIEDFFKINIEKVSHQNYEIVFRTLVFDLFKQNWLKNIDQINELVPQQNLQDFYYTETAQMLQNWYASFIKKLQDKSISLTFKEAFKSLTPITETRVISEEIKVQGVIDAILKTEKGIQLLDYKTSKKEEINEEYKLQLAIYALLYKLKYNETPYEVGIHFLKSNEKFIPVDDNLLNFARIEITDVQERTLTADIKEYNKKPSPLCKWSNGECDFFKICRPFSQKE
ncbi:PD-(D/E)XK nuclease family protein [Candidatus Woesearchaeota archaeon]|nr:PD-(D/E)XK nuclease family protein [Candidatus Woesearchaeota archaeon]